MNTLSIKIYGVHLKQQREAYSHSLKYFSSIRMNINENRLDLQFKKRL